MFFYEALLKISLTHAQGAVSIRRQRDDGYSKIWRALSWIEILIKSFLRSISAKARARRGEQFLTLMGVEPHHRILDLGGGNGSHFHSIAPNHKNVLIADHWGPDLDQAKANYGYETMLLDGSKEALPFEDRAFDIVFCSSVIEHVTGPKQTMLDMDDNKAFEATAIVHQQRFADELRRITDGYFVQTPNVDFPLEQHSMLPQPIIYLPRPLQRSLMKTIGKFWVSNVQPDWRLLTAKDMAGFFPDAELVFEKVAGFTKSITAVRKRSGQ